MTGGDAVIRGADMGDDPPKTMSEMAQRPAASFTAPEPEPVYDISTAPRRDSTAWTRVSVSWNEFLAALPGYACWLGGALSGQERSRAALDHRTMWSLDEDDAAGLEDRLGPLDGTAFAKHPTKSSTPDAPRARLLGPLSRPVTDGEYWLITQALMDALQWRKDRSGAQAERLMFGPEDRELDVYEGEPLDADAWLMVAKETGVPEREVATLGSEDDPDAPITDEHIAKARNVLTKNALQVEALRSETGEPYAGRNEALSKTLAMPLRFVARGVLDETEVKAAMWAAVQAAPGDHPFTEREFQKTMQNIGKYAEADPVLPTVITAADEFGVYDGPEDEPEVPERKQTRREKMAADELLRLRAKQDARDLLAAETAGDVQGWEPIDLKETLAGLADGSLARPLPTIGDFGKGCLFYAGKVNGVHGDSNGGKSWTALITTAQEINAGNTVVYVDLEDDALGVLARLVQDLGVAPEDVAERFVYLHPGQPFAPATVADFRALLGRVRPTLVVLDSTGEALAVSGVNPNADDEVARWFTLFPKVAAASGAAVLLIDHATKAGTNELWPIGSQRKRAGITGAAYLQKMVLPFSRGQDGHAVLKCAKDRHGNYALKQEVATLQAAFGGLSLVPGADSGSGPDWKPTELMERVSRLLEGASAPMSGAAIRLAVKGNKKYVAEATTALLSGGYVAIEKGPRRAVLHRSVKPYRTNGLD